MRSECRIESPSLSLAEVAGRRLEAVVAEEGGERLVEVEADLAHVEADLDAEVLAEEQRQRAAVGVRRRHQIAGEQAAAAGQAELALLLELALLHPARLERRAQLVGDGVVETARHRFVARHGRAGRRGGGARGVRLGVAQGQDRKHAGCAYGAGPALPPRTSHPGEVTPRER
jgi:hypothetical protein